MVTLGQRIEQLRTQKGLNRPQLAEIMKVPRLSVEKMESGRQTPSLEQQDFLAKYFGVSVLYLRGETDDPTDMNSWLNGNVPDEPVPAPSVQQSRVVAVSSPKEESPMFSAFLKSESFQQLLKKQILDVLSSKEGQEIIAKAIKKSQSK